MGASAVVHFIAFRPRGVVDDDDWGFITSNMSKFRGYPYVIESEFGSIARTAGLAAADETQGFSHAIVMRFASIEDLTERFLPDPEHLIFARWFQQRFDFATYDLSVSAL
jgi:hypothetical protein